MRHRLIIFIILLMSMAHLQAQQPEWVASLAIDPEYYIGISSCDKSIPDYQSIAAKRALGLIAEQIPLPYIFMILAVVPIFTASIISLAEERPVE